MTFTKTPIYHIRQPLIADKKKTSFTALKAPAKRRVWCLSVALSLLVSGGVGVSVLASSPQPEGPLMTTQALALPALVAPSPAELALRAHHLAVNHQLLTDEDRRQILTERISDKYRVSPGKIREIVDAAHDVGTRYKIDPIMLLAITDVESNFDPKARSSAGAIGLTQIMPNVHVKKISQMTRAGRNILDPGTSLELGAQVYSEYRTLHRGNEIRALQQYNGSLKDSKQRYSSKVMGVYRSLAQGLPAVSPWPTNTNLLVATTKGTPRG